MANQKYPEHWEISTLEVACDYIQRGTTPKYAETGKVKVLSQKCVQKWGMIYENSRFLDDSRIEKLQDYRFLKRNDVLINSTGLGTLGRVGMIKKLPGDFVCDSHVTILRANPNRLLPKFLYYYLGSKDGQAQVNFLQTGSTKQTELNKGDLIKMELPIPPIAEQQRMVEWLDKLSKVQDKGEYNWSNYWDFSMPVPSKKEQEKTLKKINNLVKSIEGLKAERDELKWKVKSIFESSTKSLILTEDIPNGWKRGEIKGFVERTKNRNPTKEPEEPFNYIDISSINKETRELGEVKELLGKDAPTRARKIIKEGDVIFATTRPYLKNIALIPQKYNDQICSTGFCVLRPREDELITNYLFHIIQTNQVMKQVNARMKGASYPAVCDKDVKAAEITVPPVSEQRKIVSKLDSISKKVKKINKEQERLDSMIEMLPKSVLTRVFAPSQASEI